MRAVDRADGGVDFAGASVHADIQHVAHRQHDLPPVGDKRKCLHTPNLLSAPLRGVTKLAIILHDFVAFVHPGWTISAKQRT